MPAPAVIPAPLAYTNAVAVKKLVVRTRVGLAKCPSIWRWCSAPSVSPRHVVVDSTLCVRVTALETRY